MPFFNRTHARSGFQLLASAFAMLGSIFASLDLFSGQGVGTVAIASLVSACACAAGAWVAGRALTYGASAIAAGLCIGSAFLASTLIISLLQGAPLGRLGLPAAAFVVLAIFFGFGARNLQRWQPGS